MGSHLEKSVVREIHGAANLAANAKLADKSAATKVATAILSQVAL